MAGRKATPDAMKKLLGNPGRRPIKEDKTEVVQWIEPPEEVKDRSRALKKWNEVCPELGAVGVLSALDGHALTMMVLAWADFLDAWDEVEAHGVLVDHTSATGVTTIKANPAIGVRDAADRRYRSVLADFGMTPSSRTKVERHPETEEKDEFFN